MLKKLLLVVALLALVGFLGPAWARDAKEEATASTTATQEEPSVGVDALPFLVSGDFDVGYRWVDTSGSENKYREDLNYTSGPRLFNFNMDITPVGSNFFDLASVEASHFGGEPFSYFGVTVQKFGSYKFRYRRNQSIYFYHDTVLPIEVSGNPANARAGDFHTFNFERATDLFDFDVKLNEMWNVFVKATRTDRKGESTTTLDISRDEFELDKPLDWRTNDISVGFQAKGEMFSFYFDQSWRDYEDDGFSFLPGLSLGEDPEDATVLFSFEQMLPFNFEMPQTTVKANLRPSSRTTVNVAYVYGNLDGDFDYDERAAGLNFAGQPLTEVFVGTGTVARTLNLFDVEASYDVGEITSIFGALKIRRLEQEGSLTCLVGPCAESELEVGETVSNGVNIDSDIFQVGVRVFPNTRAQITGGLQWENRKVDNIHKGELDEEPNTKRKPTLFFSGAYAHSKANILAEYERGVFENPFTLVSPETLNRFKVKARIFPNDPLSITGTITIRRIDYEEVPTVSVVPGGLSTDNYSVYVRYRFEDTRAYGGYTRREWDQTIVNTVSSVPGFGALPPQRVDASYDSKINNFSAGFNHNLNESFLAGADINWFDNSGSFPSRPVDPFPLSAFGSFPLDWTQFQLWGQFTMPAGYLLRIAYQRNDYDEELFDFDDYNANMVTVSVGYAF